jgi:hypothetical protein
MPVDQRASSGQRQQARQSSSPIHRHHHVTEAEKDHLSKWNGLFWLDYLNMTPGGALDVFEAERSETEQYELKENQMDDATTAAKSSKDTPKASPASKKIQNEDQRQ